MFSTNIHNTMNPLPLLPPLSGHDINVISLHQEPYPNDPFMTQFNFQNINPQLTAESFINYVALPSNNALMNDHHEQNIVNDCSGVLVPVKKPVKKDRHSKIYTAQGLRDRRVRLSIGIAREFFDLQDMLGFDKASKTLGWLLEKSRKAIKELSHIKKRRVGNKNIVGNDEDKSFVSGSSSEHFEEADSGIINMDTGVSTYNEKKTKRLEKNESNVRGKGSRAKARERARERTKRKIGNQMADDSKTCPGITLSHILNQSSSTSPCEVGEKLSTNVHGQNMSSSCNRQAIEDPNRIIGQDVIEESTFIKRKLAPFLITGYNKLNGGITSKDLSLSNNSSSNYIANLPQDWEINNNPFADSAFYPITNMNISTGLQIYGKP